MEKVGRYQIREPIGEGAMAKVFKAYDPDINRTLAIKVLKSQLRGDSEYHVRFLREAKGAGVLSHPNIEILAEGAEEGELLLRRPVFWFASDYKPARCFSIPVRFQARIRPIFMCPTGPAR